jgi:methionyl-tRNA formyltransferase
VTSQNPTMLFFGNSESQFSSRHFEAFAAAPCRIAGVVDVPPARRTSTNKPIAEGAPSFVDAARGRGLPVFEPVSPNTPDFVAAVRALAPDLLVAVGYTNLLKAELLAVPRLLAVNFHASLLPAYRGKHPVFWALRNGEKYAGLTVHVMDAHLDTGDILYQVKTSTRRTDTVTSLYERIIERSLPLAPRLVSDAAAGVLKPRPQPTEGGSYYSAVTEEDFHLDWNWPAEKLRRCIQVTPGRCYANFAGERLYFFDAQVKPNSDQQAPGTLLHIGQTCCIVAAGSDALRVRRVSKVGGGENPNFTMRQICREMGLTVGQSIL